MFNKKPVRRAQLITPWGVGGMMNFPGDESLMVCGLDALDQVYEKATDIAEFIIREERLEKRLGVKHFRLPPDFRESGPNSNLKIPFIRFPRWHYCPKCGAMEQLTIFSGTQQRCKGIAFSSGASCRATSDRKRPYLIPVRFIAICSEGHIEDFPFMEWVHGKSDIDGDCRLRLRAGSSGSLSGIRLECRCGKKKSMAGAFNQNSLAKITKCNGNRPWLGESDGNNFDCGKDLLVVQRGASNVYFPELRCSIYLPKWGSSVQRRIIEILDREWERLTRSVVNGQLNDYVFEFVADRYQINKDELMTAAHERLNLENAEDENPTDDSEELYRKAEYDAILSGAGGDNQDFFVTNHQGVGYSDPIGRYFTSISLIHKLRETRAFIGFSRWLPESGRALNEKKADLSINAEISWLPAIIVKGEGIFFEFDHNALSLWSTLPEIARRTFQLIQSNNRRLVSFNQSERIVTPKFILLHTFAHIIINQLSYVCGYGSSALRERIYCDAEFPENSMNGILIYTASGDSEGSLGGLVRQGRPGNIETIVMSALRKAQWCSSDPICIESAGQGPDSCNLAACHGCALLPETSCEENNRLLDRALLVGTSENPNIGFFSASL